MKIRFFSKIIALLFAALMISVLPLAAFADSAETHDTAHLVEVTRERYIFRDDCFGAAYELTLENMTNAAVSVTIEAAGAAFGEDTVTGSVTLDGIGSDRYVRTASVPISLADQGEFGSEITITAKQNERTEVIDLAPTISVKRADEYRNEVGRKFTPSEAFGADGSMYEWRASDETILRIVGDKAALIGLGKADVIGISEKSGVLTASVSSISRSENGQTGETDGAPSDESRGISRNSGGKLAAAIAALVMIVIIIVYIVVRIVSKNGSSHDPKYPDSEENTEGTTE